MYDQQGGEQAVSDQNEYEDDDAASNDSDDSDYEIDELEDSESDSDSDEETTSITRSTDQSNSNASNSNAGQYDSSLPSLAHADESDCVRMWDEFDPEPLYISPGRPYEQPVFSADATETTDETDMGPILNHFNLEIGN